MEGQRNTMNMSVIFWTISSHMRDWADSGFTSTIEPSELLGMDERTFKPF